MAGAYAAELSDYSSIEEFSCEHPSLPIMGIRWRVLSEQFRVLSDSTIGTEIACSEEVASLILMVGFAAKLRV